ncbi:MAG: ferredoxin--NADP reductase [Deltaproteobacteria bacterium]|nr:ferredoxin--NADP reductase [Deltaproteobacteria bacterium]
MVELNAVVIHRVEVAPGLIILRIRHEEEALPDFVPGQFAVLALPNSASRVPFSEAEDVADTDPQKMIKRAYSIASSSVERDYVEFYITLVRSGALTPRLFNLGIGDKLWLSTKFSGIFTLSDVEGEPDIVLIATGTGIAPYMSMIRTELAAPGKRRFAVIHGARNSWDLGYHSELVMMERLSPNFSYLPIISEPEEEPAPWGGESGFILDAWQSLNLEKKIGLKPTPEKTHIFLCGNPVMVQTMVETLTEDGFVEHKKNRPGQLHLERFW